MTAHTGAAALGAAGPLVARPARRSARRDGILNALLGIAQFSSVLDISVLNAVLAEHHSSSTAAQEEES